MQLEEQLIRSSNNIDPETIKLITGAIKANTQMIQWAFGICVTGFLTLVGWIFMLTRQIQNQKVLADNIEKMVDSVKMIETTLCGGFKERGLLARHYDLEKNQEQQKQDIADIKKKLNA